MRSGEARRWASYCTCSSRSRTTVLESADDQRRIPVTWGNFACSSGVAGVRTGSPASAVVCGLALAPAAGFAVAAGGVSGAAAASCGWAADGLVVLLPVTISLPNCREFHFHQV